MTDVERRKGYINIQVQLAEMEGVIKANAQKIEGQHATVLEKILSLDGKVGSIYEKLHSNTTKTNKVELEFETCRASRTAMDKVNNKNTSRNVAFGALTISILSVFKEYFIKFGAWVK